MLRHRQLQAHIRLNARRGALTDSGVMAKIEAEQCCRPRDVLMEDAITRARRAQSSWRQSLQLQLLCADVHRVWSASLEPTGNRVGAVKCAETRHLDHALD
ncbi:unnamed protein product, partial [Iphiclides podalirius]